MDSEPAGAFGAVAADPWLWIGAAAFFFGLALGQALRAVLPARNLTAVTARRRSRRIARAVAYLSLSLLFATCILIIPSNDVLDSSVVDMDVLASYAAAIAGAGALAGAFPLACGLPLLAIAAALALAIRAALMDWTLYRGPSTVARLLPYEVGDSSFRGELEVLVPGAAVGTKIVSMDSNSASICVDILEFSGPAALTARILGPEAEQGPYTPLRRFYRVAALVSESAAPVFLDPPAHLGWIETVLPLPEDAGLKPGAAPTRTEAMGSLIVRFRFSGTGNRLSPLQPMYLDFVDDGSLRLETRTRATSLWSDQ